MAYTTFNLPGNGRVVRKFDNVSTDFPSLGVIVPAGRAGIAIVADTVAGANLTVQVTFDAPYTEGSGASGTFTGSTKWYPYTPGLTAIGNSAYIVFDVSPSGIKLGGSTAGAAILC